MTVVHYRPGMDMLGSAAVAIGVFDGVHLGHQALLTACVREAARHAARAVALTFDRDPDQVITPDTAATQLLTLDDKVRFILETGIDTVLVVGFTPQIAAMQPEAFLDEVLGGCCTVRSLHVGPDFRFGNRAAGDLDTLYVWGVEHGAEVLPHPLLDVAGAPVTSTRVREAVSAGRVEEARSLLGRPTRVTGVVRQGRRQGAELGFPTANVAPVAFAALPADGVYAGWAELADGSMWPAAISVGTPPTFPDARDYLEAHLPGFEGDLYGQTLTLAFSRCLREQRSFSSLAELSAAIADDVVQVLAEASARLETEPYEPDDGLVSDPAALRAAESAVARMSPQDGYAATDEPWVAVAGPRHLSGLFGDAGFSAALITAPLDGAGIPHAWDPYPPELMPSWRYGYGVVDRPFTLLVPRSRVFEAARLLGVTPPDPGPSGD